MWLSGQLLIKNKQFLLFLNFVLQINRVIQVKKNAKICKRLSMSYPWIMQKMQKISPKNLFIDYPWMIIHR